MLTDTFTYTVEDEYGNQATATVTVTIEEAGVSFVTASADSAETLKGTAVEIDVIANDTASADNLPLVVQTGSITAPSPSGTATLQPSGKILYTPATGFTGDVSFNYTAKPSGKASPTSTAACSVRVVEVSTGTPKIPPEPTTVAKIRTVGYSRGDGSTQYSTIEAALSAAQPGDHVFLDDKDWGETPIRTSQDGGLNNHVVVRSRTHNGAILRMNILALKPHYWWYDLKLAIKPWNPSTYTGGKINDTYDYAEAYSLVLMGHHQNVTRCLVRSSNGIWINETTKSNFGTDIKTNNIALAYCTFTNDVAGAYGPHCNVYMGSFLSNSKGPLNVEIAYNLSTDPGDNPNGNPNSGYWLYTGNSQPKDTPSGNNATFELHHNNISTNKISCAYIKRGGNVRYNRFHNTGSARDQTLNIRHSGRSKEDGTFLSAADVCVVEGNLFTSGGIKVSDTDWIIRFNEFTSDNPYRDIQLMCGQARSTNGSGDSQAAHRTVLVGNKNVRKYVIGFLSPSPFIVNDDQGGKVQDVKIYKGGQSITTANITVDQQDSAKPYQLLDGQPSGTPTVTPVSLSYLTSVCGCDK